MGATSLLNVGAAATEAGSSTSATTGPASIFAISPLDSNPFGRPRRRRRTRSRTASFHPEHHQRLVIERLEIKFVEVGEDGVYYALGGKIAACAHDVCQALAAVLFSGWAEMVGNAVGVKHDHIAHLGLEGDFFIFAVRKQAE